jgi:hypothetical protein
LCNTLKAAAVAYCINGGLPTTNQPADAAGGDALDAVGACGSSGVAYPAQGSL